MWCRQILNLCTTSKYSIPKRRMFTTTKAGRVGTLRSANLWLTAWKTIVIMSNCYTYNIVQIHYKLFFSDSWLYKIKMKNFTDREAKHTAITMWTFFPTLLSYHFQYDSIHTDPLWWPPTIHHKILNKIFHNCNIPQHYGPYELYLRKARINPNVSQGILLNACPKNVTKPDVCVYKIMAFWFKRLCSLGDGSLLFRNLLPPSSGQKNHSHSSTLKTEAAWFPARWYLSFKVHSTALQKTVILIQYYSLVKNPDYQNMYWLCTIV